MHANEQIPNYRNSELKLAYFGFYLAKRVYMTNKNISQLQAESMLKSARLVVSSSETGLLDQ